MMTLKPWMASILCILPLITSARADVSQADPSGLIDQSTHFHSLYLTGELSGGVASLGASNNNAASGAGSEISAALLASWNISGLLGEWTWDGGLGIFENSFSGGGQGITQFQMTTTALFAKISPQYHLTENLQLGPIAELLFGADVGFGTSIADSAQTTSWLMGAQALYALHLGACPLKLGLRYLTSLNLPENSLSSVEATVQFGLPIF